jgi:hypothetical protein
MREPLVDGHDQPFVEDIPGLRNKVEKLCSLSQGSGIIARNAGSSKH